MKDWIVWPIFIIQLIAFILLWLPKKSFFLNLRYKHFSYFLLLVACIYIALSLYHDSMTVLEHLYF